MDPILCVKGWMDMSSFGHLRLIYVNANVGVAQSSGEFWLLLVRFDKVRLDWVIA